MRNWIMMAAVFAMLLAAGCSGRSARLPETELVFYYEDVAIPIAAPAAPVLEELGEPEDCWEEASCLFDGMDRTYCYGSFYITTGPSPQGQRITGIWFADAQVQTPEGIAIGDKVGEVISAYGPEERGDTLICDRDNTRLLILTRDGIVTSVQYQITGE